MRPMPGMVGLISSTSKVLILFRFWHCDADFPLMLTFLLHFILKQRLVFLFLKFVYGCKLG